MSTKEIIEMYYVHANAGNWDSWCDLFSEDLIMDEQIAGRIVSLKVLRPMMGGMKAAYARFQNVPKHIIVEGNQAAVVSHISALASKNPDIPIEANVMNFFRIENGKIAYMANFHDTVPFKPFIG